MRGVSRPKKNSIFLEFHEGFQAPAEPGAHPNFWSKILLNFTAFLGHIGSGYELIQKSKKSADSGF